MYGTQRTTTLRKDQFPEYKYFKSLFCKHFYVQVGLDRGLGTDYVHYKCLYCGKWHTREEY